MNKIHHGDAYCANDHGAGGPNNSSYARNRVST